MYIKCFLHFQNSSPGGRKAAPEVIKYMAEPETNGGRADETQYCIQVLNYVLARKKFMKITYFSQSQIWHLFNSSTTGNLRHTGQENRIKLQFLTQQFGLAHWHFFVKWKQRVKTMGRMLGYLGISPYCVVCCMFSIMLMSTVPELLSSVFYFVFCFFCNKNLLDKSSTLESL